MATGRKLVATQILKLASRLSTLSDPIEKHEKAGNSLHVSPTTASNTTVKGKASVYLSTWDFFFFKGKYIWEEKSLGYK